LVKEQLFVWKKRWSSLLGGESTQEQDWVSKKDNKKVFSQSNFVCGGNVHNSGLGKINKVEYEM